MHVAFLVSAISCTQAADLVRHIQGGRGVGFVFGTMRKSSFMYATRQGFGLESRATMLSPLDVGKHLHSRYHDCVVPNSPLIQD